MNRLLQGDVGSGKTLVAFLALLIAVEAGGQGVMMAPTEILARQHHEGLAPLAAAAGVRLDLLTGRDKGAERAAKLAALASGETGMLVGTHAVFQKDVSVSRSSAGRRGRTASLRRGASGWNWAPRGGPSDVLVMTATPIPRTLALASYGDMDVSVLDEKPPGRKPVRTALISADRFGEVVDHLSGAIAEGRQAYWVCPLVEESEVVDLTARRGALCHAARGLGRGRGGAGPRPDAIRRKGCRDGALRQPARPRFWSRRR